MYEYLGSDCVEWPNINLTPKLVEWSLCKNQMMGSDPSLSAPLTRNNSAVIYLGTPVLSAPVQSLSLSISPDYDLKAMFLLDRTEKRSNFFIFFNQNTLKFILDQE